MAVQSQLMPVLNFLVDIYVTGNYAISAIVQFPRQLHNSLGNCTIAGIAQFPLTYTYSDGGVRKGFS
jgi:hypothetical protein